MIILYYLRNFLQIYFFYQIGHVLNLSNCIIYNSLYALQVSEDIKYILNNTFQIKKIFIFNKFKGRVNPLIILI